MITQKVFTNELENRIDPNYYHPRFVSFFSKLKQSKYDLVNLSEITKSVFQGVGKNETNDNDVTLLKVKNITQESGIDYEDVEYVKDVPESKLLETKDIISPFIGEATRLGKFALFNGSDAKYTVDNNTGVIRADKTKILPEYLLTVLSSEIGKVQIERLIGGGGVPFLGAGNAKLLQIPLPTIEQQREIALILQNALQSKEEKLKQADELLNSIDDFVRQHLGIDYKEPEEKTTFTTLSDEIAGKRLDPKKYSQKPKAILTAIKKAKYPQLTLNDLIVASLSGDWGNDLFDNNAKVSKDTVQVKVLRNTNFDNSLNLNLDNVAERLIERNKFVKNKLQNGDILIEKSGGSPIQPVGRVAIFDNIKGDYYFSNFLQCIRINTTKCLPYYLFVYLRSIYTLNYMEYLQNQTTGIKNLIWEEFTDTPIVLPPKDIQEKLTDETKDRMTKAIALRHEASTVLKQAKKQVEAMILN